MKKKIMISAVLVILTMASTTVFGKGWTTGLDIYSSYVWRGTKFGSGPAFQPSIKYNAGGFTAGAWGSYSASTNEAAESDIYLSYSVGLGEKSSLAFTVTDYYFPGSPWLKGKSHYIEPLATLSLSNFSLTGGYMINNGAGDVYLEAGLLAGPVKLTLGGGDGVYTTDGKFNLCNIGIGTSKEIKITDSFSIPVSGSAILNPSSEQFYIVVGISL